VARPFKTHHNTLDMDLFLRIAPELYLKRLTVADLIASMRSTATSATRPGMEMESEFTMLEAYQAYTDYFGIMETTQASIEQAVKM